MSNEKPSRLSGFVAPKGNVERPVEVEKVLPAGPAVGGMGSKSLTLRLPEVEYERLRTYAFSSRQSHQTILSDALREYLDRRA